MAADQAASAAQRSGPSSAALESLIVFAPTKE
jgi:hypothetical protein